MNLHLGGDTSGQIDWNTMAGAQATPPTTIGGGVEPPYHGGDSGFDPNNDLNPYNPNSTPTSNTAAGPSNYNPWGMTNGGGTTPGPSMYDPWGMTTGGSGTTTKTLPPPPGPGTTYRPFGTLAPTPPPQPSGNTPAVGTIFVDSAGKKQKWNGTGWTPVDEPAATTPGGAGTWGGSYLQNPTVSSFAPGGGSITQQGNPLQWASSAAANSLAQNLGGTVKDLSIGGPGISWSDPQKLIQYGGANGPQVNAGLTADTFNRYGNSPTGYGSYLADRDKTGNQTQGYSEWAHAQPGFKEDPNLANGSYVAPPGNEAGKAVDESQFPAWAQALYGQQNGGGQQMNQQQAQQQMQQTQQQAQYNGGNGQNPMSQIGQLQSLLQMLFGGAFGGGQGGGQGYPAGSNPFQNFMPYQRPPVMGPGQYSNNYFSRFA